MTEPRKRSLGDRLFTWLLGVVFAVMVVELVLLTRQNRDLKAAVSSLHQQLSSMRSAISLKEGEVVEPLELPTLTGERVRLAYDDPDRDTILLVFSPDCPACEENLDGWRRLSAAHDPAREALVYVSTAEPEKTREFARDHALPDPVLLSDAEALTRYKVQEIPATIVVGPGGVVKRVWVGVLSEEALELFRSDRS